MAIISVFSAFHSRTEDIVAQVSQSTGWPLITDELYTKTAERHGSPREKLERAMTGPPFLFNKFTHRRERYLGQLRSVLAELLADQQILHGFAAHLIPQRVGHVLRVCLLDDPELRAERLVKDQNVSLPDARKRIHAEDTKRAEWTRSLYDKQPWDASLYDLKIPVYGMDVTDAAQLIVDNAQREMMKPTEDSRQALRDFAVATEAEQKMIDAGFYHAVSCRAGVVTVTVDEYVVRLGKLEEQLQSLLLGIDQVRDVKVKTGANYRPTSMLSPMEFELPDKVLLVDDERDFVLTLSERLLMRNLEPAVAFSGEQALELMAEEEPEVVVLDLKMPGIDGIEVLQRAAKEYPDVKIIVLTGHGSEKDKNRCMELGAFAYLEKPVDLDVLAETMRRAKEAGRGESASTD